jgi:hypothetical protein
MFICEHCGSELKTLSNLKQHQKTVKSCLKIQTQKNLQPQLEEITCKYCNRTFTKKYNYESHINLCKGKDKHFLEQEKHEVEHLKNTVMSLSLQLSQIKEILEQKDNQLTTLTLSLKEKDDFIDKLIKKSSQNKSLNANTIINQNNYYNIDISQERFNQLIKSKYDFNLYEKGGEGGRQLIIEFLSNTQNRYRAEIADYARNKIKLINIDSQEVTFIDNNTLFSLCKNSEPLKDLLISHGNTLLSKEDDPSSIQTNLDKVTFRTRMFRSKDSFNTEIFYPVKCYIQTSGLLTNHTDTEKTDIVQCDELNLIEQSEEKMEQNDIEQTIMEIKKFKQVNHIRDFMADNDEFKEVSVDKKDYLYDFDESDSD